MAYRRVFLKKLVRAGVNASGDLGFASSKRPKLNSLSFMQDTSQKAVGNAWLANKVLTSSGMAPAKGPAVDVRLRDEFGLKLSQRNKFSWMYGGCVAMTRSLTRRLLKRVEKEASDMNSMLGQSKLMPLNGASSVLAPIESRLMIVRWRSGLVKSVPMAARRIRSKMVFVKGPEDTEFKCVPVANYHRVEGSIVKIRPDVWKTMVNSMIDYWKMDANMRSIPAHLYVSMAIGSVSLISVPKEHTVLFPLQATFSLRSFRKG